VFEPAAGGVVFRAATGLDATAVTQVQAGVRRRLLRSFVRRGLLPTDDAQAMAQWQHGGGFSVDASVRIAATDRAGRERLLRYCARPPFALDRLHELDPERLLYESAKQSPGGTGPQILTPLQLLDRLAVLVPPPRVHRHRHLLVRPCDRLLGVFATTSTVWMWPVVAGQARTVSNRGCRVLPVDGLITSRSARRAVPGTSCRDSGPGAALAERTIAYFSERPIPLKNSMNRGALGRS